jgi:glucokinase
MFLAGDIGGTNSRLAFFEHDDSRLRLVVEATYPSRSYPGLAPILQEFLASHPGKAEAACFGIAGPVRKGRVVTPNLPWEVDAAQLTQELHCGPVTLLNDLEANAYGLLALRPEDFVVLNAGAADAAGNVALISAGTGLGEAGLFWDGRWHHPFASEGGHADFAPRTALEIELAQYLIGRFGHVSFERVLSGPGLANLYEFLRQRSGAADELPELMKRLGTTNVPATISIAALKGHSELCNQALDLFVSIYGAEAGNLALKLLATGGVFLGGGIAPKILPRLRQSGFLQAFLDKGRMRQLMESFPVRVILNENTALLGAAHYAASRIGLS